MTIQQGRNFGPKSGGTNSGEENEAPLDTETEPRPKTQIASDDSRFFTSVLKSWGTVPSVHKVEGTSTPRTPVNYAYAIQTPRIAACT